MNVGQQELGRQHRREVSRSRLRLTSLAVVCLALLTGLVSPVSAQAEDEAEAGTDTAQAEAASDGSPTVDTPLADGVIPAEARAAIEESVSNGDAIGAAPAAPGEGVAVVEASETAAQVDEGVAPESSAPESRGIVKVPASVSRGRDSFTGEEFVAPAAIAPNVTMSFGAAPTDGAKTSASLEANSSAQANAGSLAGQIQLVRPESDSAIGVTLKTLDDAATAKVSTAGLGLELQIDGTVGSGAALAADGRTAQSDRPELDLGSTSGWELHFDLEAFAGSLMDVTSVGFLLNIGCDQSSECDGVQELPSHIDEKAGTAILEIPANLLTSFGAPTGLDAAGAGAADSLITVSAIGKAGNHAASPYESLSTWQVGLLTGHAELSYNIPLPDGNGYVPQLSYSYSSGLVDGMNRTANNQPSVVGLGWSEPNAVITRDITGCIGQNTVSKNICPKSGNRHDGFSISFEGVGGPLVRTTASETGENHPYVSGAKYWEYVANQKNDWRIWRVEQPNGGPSNGDQWGTWWEVTTGDGTLFVFGREHIFRPSGGSGLATTRPRATSFTRNLQSMQMAPIYFFDGTRSGANCVVGGDLCQAGLAWHLDQVIDTSGNMATYQYTTEINKIRPVVNGTTYPNSLQYDRAVVVDWIDYGRQFGNTAAAWGTNVPFRVNMVYSDRKEGNSYPDTPTNLECTANTNCAENTPSFFTKKRLSGIGVYVGNTWRYGWELNHSYPLPSDESGYTSAKKSLPKLWLDSIKRSGLPNTTFSKTFKDNRVNAPDQVSRMQMPRIGSMTTESGATITYTYGQSHAPNNDSNSVCYRLASGNAVRRPCDMYPSWDGETPGPGVVWWHKWKVMREVANAREGGSQNRVTDFKYRTPPAWAHNSLGAGGSGYWNDYRGHHRVDVIDGSGAPTEHYFYTGLYDDKANAGSNNILGGTGVGKVQNPWGNSIDNRFALAGQSLGTVSRAVPSSTGWAPALTREIIQTSWTHDVDKSHAVIPPRYLDSYRVTQQVRYQDIYSDPQTGAYDRSSQVIDFDSYGRVYRFRDRGLPGTGDDTSEYRTFKNQHTGWFLSQPTFIGVRPSDTSSTNTTSGFSSAQKMAYDTYGRVSREDIQYRQVSNTNLAPKWRGTRYTYDNRGNVKTVINEGGSGTGDDQKTTFSYNSYYGYVTAEDGPLNGTIDRYTFKVDPAWNQITEQRDPNGRNSYQTFDGFGRLKTVRLAGYSVPNYKFTYGLSNAGVDWVKTETLRNNNATSTEKYVPSWTYTDGLGRTIQTQERHPWDDSKSAIISTRYDNTGRVLTMTEPAWRSTSPGSFRWEGWGNPGVAHTRYEYPRYLNTNQGCDYGVNTVAHSYDSSNNWRAKTQQAVCGLESRTWDRAGHRSASYSDAHGRLLKTTDADGANMFFTHNQRGDLTEVRDHYGTKTKYEYWNWETSGPSRITDPDSGQTIISYDGHGREYERTSARGIKLRTSYDKANRRTSVRYVSSSGLKDVSKWRYDNSGDRGLLAQTEHWNINQHGDAKGWVSEKFDYDSRGNLTLVDQKIQDQGWKKTRYKYMDSGQPYEITHPNGKKVKLAYDRMDRISWIGYQSTSIVNWASYNARGQLAGLKRGSDSATQHVATYYEYDDRTGWLTQAGSWRNGTKIQMFNYQYSADGMLTRIRESGQTGNNYTCANYDSVHRLTRAWTRTDGNCSNQSSNWSGPEPFQVAYTYDKIGSIKWANGEGTPGGDYIYNSGHTHAPSRAGSNTYLYDAAGNRTRAVVAGKTTNYGYDIQDRLATTWGETDATMLYNADGVRVRRIVEGTKTYYYRDGYELSGTNKSTQSINLNGMLVATVDGSTVWSQVTNHVGTPTYARSATGQIEIRRNTPYGMPRSSSSTIAGGPSDLSFTGQRDDDPLDLMSFGARFYDPALGQFTQPDVLVPDFRTNMGWNRYAYVYNNPFSFNDPTGNCPNSTQGGLGGLGDILCAIGFGSNDAELVEEQIRQQSNSFAGDYAKQVGGDAKAIPVDLYQAVRHPVRTVKQTASCVGSPLDCGRAIAAEAARPCSDSFSWGSCAGRATTLYVEAVVSVVTATGARRGLSPGYCSFSAETQVLMADGTTKPISEVEVDDWVLAQDPETGERGPRQVVHLWVHQDTLVDLEIHGHEVATTRDHPFWNHTDGEWQRADVLDAGDLLLAADGGLVAVAGIDWGSSRTSTAYNLTVDDIHTYFVHIGDQNILVHNNNGLCDISGYEQHLTQRDLDAARREAAGEVVARKASGVPWDHLDEVTGAQRGLLRRIESMKRRLAWPGLSTTERLEIQRALGGASRLLDYSERYVPRSGPR